MTREVQPRSATRLDSYVDRYAARTKGMTASEIRALFAVASRPEVVSLAGGMPMSSARSSIASQRPPGYARTLVARSVTVPALVVDTRP